MKRFLLVVLVVLVAIGILAACAPVEQGVEYAKKNLPEWAIVVGAIVVLCIGAWIVFKLIPGFIKFIVLLILVAIVAGVSWGLWPKEAVTDAAGDLLNQAIDKIEELTEGEETQP